MFQYITADVLPLSPRLKKHCLTNPDFLLKVSVTNSEGLDGEAGENSTWSCMSCEWVVPGKGRVLDG
jgi:hypothetical protein